MSTKQVLTVLVKGIGGVAVGTLLVGVIGDRIGSYYADVSSAHDLKDQLSEQVISFTSEEAEGLQVLAQDLDPNSALVVRCHSGPDALPKVLRSRPKICRDAALASLLGEQERNLAVRSTHLKGLVLQKSLVSTLESGDPADAYGKLLTALEIMRKLNSSDTCGKKRVEAGKRLANTYPWLTSEVTDDLVGPMGTVPCDDHGPGFKKGADFVTQGLAFEGEVVGADIRQAKVEDRLDSRSDLLKSLYSDRILLILLGVGILAGFFVLRQQEAKRSAHQRQPRHE